MTTQQDLHGKSWSCCCSFILFKALSLKAVTPHSLSKSCSCLNGVQRHGAKPTKSIWSTSPCLPMLISTLVFQRFLCFVHEHSVFHRPPTHPLSSGGQRASHYCRTQPRTSAKGVLEQDRTKTKASFRDQSCTKTEITSMFHWIHF